jgi:hypothetical protein
MKAATIIEKPEVEISPSILNELESQIHEQGQIIVHCIQECNFPSFIRIWPTTYLYDHHSEARSELVHAENICYFPEWQAVSEGQNYFTLIFPGLPKSCVIFDLIEHCSNEHGAFKALNIVRTKSDVYFVHV